MIKLQRLVIEEFRGIRKLEVELNEKSFVLHGPNGSGKSGVVDAIGFALTGTSNDGDELSFKAELTPSSGKLDLAVDFYSLGMFPPGAYHSEGHQDGMGIYLYLALLERILNTAFTFAVLDDVVTSVDMNHRRQLCELLKTVFPAVQFIITTHNKIWAKQMVSAGLVMRRQGIEFYDWTVTAGPAAEHGKDCWDKIDEDLQANDVPGAASRLRRALESELPEIAEALGARVAYRGDARYDMGEYKTGVDGRHNDLLKKASDSASSWNDGAASAKVKDLRAARMGGHRGARRELGRQPAGSLQRLGQDVEAGLRAGRRLLQAVLAAFPVRQR